jgi:transaldolase
LARLKITAQELYERLAIADIRATAGLLRPVHQKSQGLDGYVSLEVSPHLAYDTEATLVEAQRLWAQVARPNLMIKVPATRPGLRAIRPLIAAGVNVNVTLLFSVERYREVAEAYMAGLEDRQRAGGGPLGGVASVASFFLSRIDTLIDACLDDIGTSPAAALRGAAAVSCARLAYQEYRRLVSTPRWNALAAFGARPQRLLWASTSTKNKAYSDLKYVEALIAADTVNTMPADTLAAFRDHGDAAVRIEEDLEAARALGARLASLGIHLDEVAQRLEEEGVSKFVHPYDKLLAALGRRTAENAAPPA